MLRPLSPSALQLVGAGQLWSPLGHHGSLHLRPDHSQRHLCGSLGMTAASQETRGLCCWTQEAVSKNHGTTPRMTSCHRAGLTSVHPSLGAVPSRIGPHTSGQLGPPSSLLSSPGSVGVMAEELSPISEKPRTQQWQRKEEAGLTSRCEQRAAPTRLHRATCPG